MSRTVIAAVVAAVIVALTGIALVAASTSFADRRKQDADARLTRAYQVVQQLHQLERIDVSNQAERLAAAREFAAAIKASGQAERQLQARLGFQRFTIDEAQGAIKPDIVALVDATGSLLAMNEVPAVVARQWKTDSGESIIPGLDLVVNKRAIVSDVWSYGNAGMMKVGVAPVIDPDAPASAKDPGGAVLGAVVVAYAQTARQAQKERDLLGTEIAYHDGAKVVATSFTPGATSEEDTATRRLLIDQLRPGAIAEGAKHTIAIAGVDYLAAAVKLPRSATRKPHGDSPTAGTVLLAAISEPDHTERTVMWLIALAGGGALAIALVGVHLSHRRLTAQIDQIELAVTDLLNGNVDRSFRPVGLELDGLASGLDVLLARLLGRPEPGEELDDAGNPVAPGRIDLEDAEASAVATPDPDLAALAQEPEPDYYHRVYTEYLAARRPAGSPDEVSFESFVATLQVNERKFKAQYRCRAVRFRLVVQDGKVTLKPVPIFA